MKVTLNSKEFEIDEGTTLEELLSLAKVRLNGIAVALNSTVVPEAMRGKTLLREGDSVIVITAFYGG